MAEANSSVEELRRDRDPYAVEVGLRLIEARNDLGASQKEIAELIQVSERSMQAYERGEVVPYRKTRDLSMVLNRPISWILHGDRAQDVTGDLGPALQEILEVLKEIRNKL